MNRADYWVTRYAAEQMIFRRILLREMRAVLADPDQSYSMSSDHPRASRWRIVQGGRLGIVVDEVAREVVTVVFRDIEDWAEFLPETADAQ